MKTIRLICCMVCMMAFATTVRGQSASYWSCDPHAYRYDMTAYVQLKCDGMLLTDYSDYEVAAFCGDECRGVATVLTVPASGGKTIKVARIRVRSNTANGDDIHLKAYQYSTKTETSFDNGFTFASMSVQGSPSTPLILKIGNDYPKGDVDGSGFVDISDVTLLVNIILGKATDTSGRADVDESGFVDISDVTLLVNIILGKVH